MANACVSLTCLVASVTSASVVTGTFPSAVSVNAMAGQMCVTTKVGAVLSAEITPGVTAARAVLLVTMATRAQVHL